MPWPLDDKPVGPIANALRGIPAASPIMAPSTPFGPAGVVDGQAMQGANKTLMGPDGKPAATAAFAVFPDKIEIHDIQTAPSMRRQGYASALMDDIFREFAGKKITAPDMTQSGKGFFGSRYDVGQGGELTPRASERAIGGGILGNALSGGSFSGGKRTNQ